MKFKGDNTVDFVIRKSFTCELVGEVFYTPFEILNLFLTIKVLPVVLDPNQNDDRKINIKFNCMDTNKFIVLDHTNKTTFGSYEIAVGLL
jgi:hypothetical protein